MTHAPEQQEAPHSQEPNTRVLPLNPMSSPVGRPQINSGTERAPVARIDRTTDSAYIAQIESRLNPTRQPKGPSAAKGIAKTIAALAVVAAAGVGMFKLANHSAKKAGTEAREQLLSKLPKDSHLSPADQAELNCIVGRIGTRCAGISRLGIDTFETQHCDIAKLDKLDDVNESKEDNLVSLGIEAKTIAAKAGLEPRFMCSTAGQETNLDINVGKIPTRAE